MPICEPNEKQVLTKALLRAAAELGISQAGLAGIIGVSPASVSRKARDLSIDPANKEGELGLLFIRLFRSLDAMVGGNSHQARLWFNAPNAHLAGKPCELVRTARGLVHVTDYLDALRGKN